VAVLVAILAPGSPGSPAAGLGPGDVLAVLQGGSNAPVADVQHLPDEPSVYIIEVWDYVAPSLCITSPWVLGFTIEASRRGGCHTLFGVSEVV
jgi:hypothetical protein